MTAAMDSPDHSPIMPSSDIQGSPFFHFLCSLSPIKQVKLGHGAQTFSELNFPPPPAVFVSPKVENQQNSAPSKRRILPGTSNNGEEKGDICDAVRSAAFVSDVEKNLVTWRQAIHGQQQLAATACSHSATPSGAALNSEAIQVPEDDSSKPEKVGSQARSGEVADCKLEYLNNLPGGQHSVWDTKHLISQEPSAALVKEAPGQGSARILHGNYVKMLDQCVQSHPHQSMADEDKAPSYLLSNDLEKMAASWSLPVEYLSKILAPINGTAHTVDQSANVDVDLPQASKEPSNVQSGEEVKAESINNGWKASASGVRRRCLDFETLETQQVSPDTLPALKMLDLSSDNPSRGAFTSKMEADNRDPCMSDNNAWDCGMPTFSNTHTLPQYTRMLNLPNAPYLPSQQNITINSQVPGPGPSLQVKPTCRGLLDTGSGYSLPGMTHLRTENEQNLVQSSDFSQPEYCSNFDQELLLSLVRRTRMLQHDLLLANSAAHTRMAMPTPFYPSVGVGINPMEENSFSSEMESGPTLFMDKSSAPRQEASHQSESDHQEDSTQSPRSPRKKRKILTQTGDNTGEGCKNCKCKKSKCLKLYCECFAAGVYCIDICNCHDCYNKPEFEETVLGTRQQIESRNPLAFLPKIIRASDASPTAGEEINDTPASARHKRGCNCKKSQCLKKYCECYQAGVGCADGCRCEGCKNIYGRNEGTGEPDDKDQQNVTSDMKVTTIDESDELDLKHSNDLQNRDLCPITPYLENSGQCRSDGDFGSAEQLTSPLEHPTSTISLQSPSRLLELLEETENFGQLNLQTYQTATTNIVSNHPFSPRWDGQTDIFTPTPPMRPLQRLPPEVSDALLFGKANASHPIWQTQLSSSNMGSYVSSLTNPDTTQSSLVQPILPISFAPDTSHFETPENALAVPVTPLPSTAYASRPNYDYEELSETRPSQSVWITDEDDSPNVLRELNTFCAPNIITKSRSPQQKRIFSYQRSTGLRNTLSPGVGSRNGRKFILHALPSSGYLEKPRENE